MSERKPISKSVRFEVFKRDAFTCQYCGAKAPDVLLHIDHIRPVADGGENDLLNLVTACAGCNLGKADRLLSDHSVIEKQRDQLLELNERRQQLEMLVEWREGLRSLDADYLDAVQREFLNYGTFVANESGKRDIEKWLKKYELAEIFKAIETSFGQYLVYADDGNPTTESWSRAFNMVPRIIEMNRQGGLSETMRWVFYARGILRKRLPHINERDAIWLMKAALAGGLGSEALIYCAKQCRSWRQFENEMYSHISGETL